MISGEAFNKYIDTIAEAIFESVVLIVSDNGTNYFSGTVLQGNKENFIITAKHCLKDISDPETIQIFSKKNNNGLKVIGPKYVYLDDVDLGLINLTKEESEILKVRAKNISTINSNAAGAKKEIYTIGFPAQLIEEKNKIYHPRPVFYRSIISERFPNKEEFSDNAEHKYYFVEWDEYNTINLDKIKLSPIALQGMSGAGVYTTIPLDEESQIWDFTNLEFSGIISSVNRKAKLIKCVRSEYVLRFLGAKLEFKRIEKRNNEHEM